MLSKPSNCVLCQSSELSAIEKFEKYTLYQCNNCDGQFWWPLEHPGTDYYKTNFSEKKYSWLRKKLGFVSRNHKYFLKLIRENTELPAGALQTDKLLDIGCADGRFLKLCKNAGFDVWGLEIDNSAVEFCRAEGLKDVFKGMTDHFSKKWKNKFNYITLIETLEHTANPAEIIEDVAAMLKDGGRIYLSVPYRNSTTPISRCKFDFPPAHLTRWSVRSVSSLLEKSGFIMEKIFVEPCDFLYLARHINHLMYNHKTFVRLAVAASGALILWPPLYMFGGKGESIYCLARKNV